MSQRRISESDPGPAGEGRDQPLDRAFAILGAISTASGPASVTDLATQCDLPVPTVHRLVLQLERRGLLKRVLGTKKVVVGYGLVQLGAAALEAALRSDRSHQILVSLATELGEHCQIGVRTGNEVLYVDSAQAVRSTGLHFQQGRRAPLHCTSIGKLYLAEMTDNELVSWLSHAHLEAVTPKTVTKPSAIRTLVATVRSAGWATSNEEVAAGVVGCAVPIRAENGLLVAGLGISVPSARVSYKQISRFRAPLERAAVTIARSIVMADE